MSRTLPTRDAFSPNYHPRQPFRPPPFLTLPKNPLYLPDDKDEKKEEEEKKAFQHFQRHFLTPLSFFILSVFPYFLLTLRFTNSIFHPYSQY
jgi:hypothetical protein